MPITKKKQASWRLLQTAATKALAKYKIRLEGFEKTLTPHKEVLYVLRPNPVDIRFAPYTLEKLLSEDMQARVAFGPGIELHVTEAPPKAR